MSLPDSPGVALLLMWVVTLILSGVVALVVIGLLYWIHHEGNVILDRVVKIHPWAQSIGESVGKVHHLRGVNESATRALAGAHSIGASVAAIEGHTAQCPGCPQCLNKGGA